MSTTDEPVHSGPLTVEGDATLFEAFGIVFRMNASTFTWTRCGTGAIQLLKDRSTRRTRFFSQRRSTKEVMGNHLVPIPSDTKLQPNKAYEERSWVWVANSDYSNNTGVPMKEIFAVRFKTGADAQTFKAAFEYAQRNNKELEQGASSMAQLLTTRMSMAAEASGAVGIAGTAVLGSESEENGVVLNHVRGAESVPANEGGADGPA